MLTEAIVGHLIGDYLLQNDWMASNKKVSSWPCFVHCLIWTVCVCLVGSLFRWEEWAFLFCCHFIQDRTHIIAWYMDHTGQADFRTGVCAPWSSIVVDNSFHIVQILIVVKLWGVVQ